MTRRPRKYWREQLEPTAALSAPASEGTSRRARRALFSVPRVMVSAVHGTLIECDVPTKVFILHLNDEQLPSERFVIQDLDETHLLVQPHRVELVRAEVKKFQERSQYVPER